MTTKDPRNLLRAKGRAESASRGTPEKCKSTDQPLLVWYASYGSNMCIDRFTCYLSGGAPSGARLAYPGCRDHRAPLRAIGYKLAVRLMVRHNVVELKSFKDKVKMIT